MKRRKFLILFLVVLAVFYFTTGLENESTEDVNINAGVGFDIYKNAPGLINYQIHRAVYVFEENGVTSHHILTGEGISMGATRQERHTKSNKKDLTGQEKVYILSDTLAEAGIGPALNIVYKNPLANNTSFFTVCKGDSLDILEYNIQGYPSSADYIEGMIRNGSEYNFFSDNYNAMDVYVRVGAEGRNVVMPYIELKKNPSKPEGKELEITGTALFKKDKMVAKLNMDDTRIMNLLRENNVKGILKIQKDPKRFTEFYAKSKRKVKCTKTGDKYNFIINLQLTGQIVSNELFKDLINDPKQKKKFENELASSVEDMCNTFLEKMRFDYKIDTLELGDLAASKYGRKTGVDWNEIVEKSNIKVNVKVNVDNQGRGDY